MSITLESRNDSYSETDNRPRAVMVYTNGIRVVVLGDSESWTRYTIVPRSYLIGSIRRLRAAGRSYHDCDWWNLIPNEFVGYTHSGAAGQSFAHDMWRRNCNSRFVTFVQSGGLDV